MIHRTLTELAALCGASLEGDGTVAVRGPAGLAEAGPDQVSFLAHPRYVALLGRTRAAGVLVSRDQEAPRAGLNLLRCDDPGRAFTAVVQAFVEPLPAPAAGVHPTASVAPDAQLDPSAAVGPGCVIEGGAVIGAGVVLRALVYVGAEAHLGRGTVVEPGVVIGHRVRVGERCRLHGGVVLGSDGFGFEPTAAGWQPIPQCGTVVLEDEVEVGANCTVDRARFGATRLGRGAKLDNLVHVAHNVQVGAAALIIAQAGIAGSATIGPRAVLAGQVGVAGHVEVGAGVRIGGQSGVYADILEPGDYMGTPARPRVANLRGQAAPKRLERLAQRVSELEARLAALESGTGSA